MSNFLSNIVQKNIEPEPSQVLPRLPGLFEPTSLAEQPSLPFAQPLMETGFHETAGPESTIDVSRQAPHPSRKLLPTQQAMGRFPRSQEQSGIETKASSHRMTDREQRQLNQSEPPPPPLADTAPPPLNPIETPLDISLPPPKPNIPYPLPPSPEPAPELVPLDTFLNEQSSSVQPSSLATNDPTTTTLLTPPPAIEEENPPSTLAKMVNDGLAPPLESRLHIEPVFSPPESHLVPTLTEPLKPSDPPPPPTINVHIGRIEVKTTPPSTQKARKSKTAAPVMSLDEYLRRRNGRAGL